MVSFNICCYFLKLFLGWMLVLVLSEIMYIMVFHHSSHIGSMYYSTFWSLAIIKLFVKMSIFLEIIYLKCWNSQNFRKRKTYKIGGNLGGSFFNPVHHCNASFQELTTFLYPIGWWNVMSPLFLLNFRKFAKVIVYSRNSWRSYNNNFFPKYMYFQSSYLKAPFNPFSKSCLFQSPILSYKKEIDNQIKN